MKSLKDLTPAHLQAFNTIASNIQEEMKAAHLAFLLAYDLDPMEFEPYKQLVEMNENLLEITFKEFKRQTTENKFKDTDTDTQTETNN